MPPPPPQAAKFVPLAGEAPPFSATLLHPTAELLHRAGYWERAPDMVFGLGLEEMDEDDEDDDAAMTL